MFKISIGPYILQVQRDTLPSLYAEYCQHATLVEEFDTRNREGAFCFVSVSLATGWPMLVVVQKFSPSMAGFDPGVLLIPETKVLFIGAGERLVAYRLDPLTRLWEDKAGTGFWHWSQHDDCVLMAAELELAAWDWHGKKLWTTFVEPPWGYRVTGDQVQLDVMGRDSEFGLRVGPNAVSR